MKQLQPGSTRTDTLFPYPALFRAIRPTLPYAAADMDVDMVRLAAGPSRLAARFPLRRFRRLCCAHVTHSFGDNHNYSLETTQPSLPNLPSYANLVSCEAESLIRTFRSEERREGKECVSTCRSRGA